MRKIITLLLISFFCAGFMEAEAQKKPEMCKIYIFGFGASFTDSVACQTNIQQLDDAWIEPKHKFLVDRSLYSMQLQDFMGNYKAYDNAICTVFFSTSLRKLQRTWKKIKKRYEGVNHLRYMIIPEGEFAFKAEEYREITIGDEIVPSEDSASKPAPPEYGRKSKRKEKKS